MKDKFELIWYNMLFYLDYAQERLSGALHYFKRGRTPNWKPPGRLERLVKSARKKSDRKKK